MKLPGLVPNGRRQPSYSLRTLRELRDEPPAARALQARCDRTSSSVQHERLDELTGAGPADPGRGRRPTSSPNREPRTGQALESLDAPARR